MNTLNLEHFVRQLIAETLFYDEEYGAVGNLSLVDTDTGRERYIASFIPDEGTFVIEEAIAWDEDDTDEEIGYALAIDSEEYGSYTLPEEAAEVFLTLAREHGLLPSITLLFEEEGV